MLTGKPANTRCSVSWRTQRRRETVTLHLPRVPVPPTIATVYPDILLYEPTTLQLTDLLYRYHYKLPEFLESGHRRTTTNVQDFWSADAPRGNPNGGTGETGQSCTRLDIVTG